jgi:subtilisin family serine protease
LSRNNTNISIPKLLAFSLFVVYYTTKKQLSIRGDSGWRCRMLNSYLEKTLYSQPVQPIMIEVNLAKLSETLGEITGLRLPLIGMVNQTFGLAALAPVTPELIKWVNSLPGVIMVHADLQARALQVPSDSAEWWPTSQSRKVMEAEMAFIDGFTAEAIKVGVADTGADVLHEQLRGAETYSTIAWPFREVLDENGHGSHVASTIAGMPVNTPVQMEVEGVSRARIVAVKCLGRGIGTGFNSEIANAMSTCYEKGCQVISMSLGSDSPQGSIEEDPLCRMVSALTRKGMIIVVAAGNSGPEEDTINSPGCSPDALTVAAIDKEGHAADFSSRGGPAFLDKPDVCAPGVLIYSGTSRISAMAIEQPHAGYGFVAISGTSMATPHVSGLVALLKQKYPSLTTAAIKDTMRRRGRPHDNALGYGIPKWSYFN